MDWQQFQQRAVPVSPFPPQEILMDSLGMFFLPLLSTSISFKLLTHLKSRHQFQQRAGNSSNKRGCSQVQILPLHKIDGFFWVCFLCDSLFSPLFCFSNHTFSPPSVMTRVPPLHPSKSFHANQNTTNNTSTTP
jgi:hypothetical protein